MGADTRCRCGSTCSILRQNTRARRFVVSKVGGAFSKIGSFGTGIWRYWRFGEPAPESNHVVQRLYGYTEGRSNDILFRVLDRRRRETDPSIPWKGESLLNQPNASDPSIEEAVRALKRDGIVVLPHRL